MITQTKDVKQSPPGVQHQQPETNENIPLTVGERAPSVSESRKVEVTVTTEVFTQINIITLRIRPNIPQLYCTQTKNITQVPSGDQQQPKTDKAIPDGITTPLKANTFATFKSESRQSNPANVPEV